MNGKIGNPKLVFIEDIVKTNEETYNPPTCEHKKYCTGHTYSMKCNYEDTRNKCRLKKFYDKYGEYWEEMGI